MTELFTDQVSEETLDRLHRRLVASADADGMLDVAYRTVDSPLGTLLVAATEAGLVRVAFDGDVREDALLTELADRVSPRVLSAPARLDAVATELEEYFAGRRRGFDLALDTRLAHGFRLEVIRHLPEIGYGSTTSYAAMAERSGSPRAFRAVGTACARNPLPLVLPCHRVVPSDGSMGQYAGGPERKRALLDLESAH